MQQSQNKYPKLRRGVIKRPLNDPGPKRGIYALDEVENRRSGPLGLNYHPTGNATGNVRASLEPLNTEGRQYMYRHKDEIPSGGRSPTWPGRGRDSAAHTRFEDNQVSQNGSWLSRQAKKKEKEERKEKERKKKEALLQMQAAQQ
jgi:hypothetical protein